MEKLKFDQQITFIYVNDLQISSAFYEGVMGFPLVLDQGSCRIVCTSKGGYLGYCLKEITSPKKQDIILTFVTAEVDKWYTHLKKNNLQIIDAPKNNLKYDIYQFFLKDPDDYLIEIQQFHTPKWEESRN
ncbi:MAG: VOC family protein [Anaerolineales bacterium]|nr:VOC family protein [Anaerolineales bacterium]